jgi:anti-sigma regulatory factor (Ser/Thr protein kinase)
MAAANLETPDDELKRLREKYPAWHIWMSQARRWQAARKGQISPARHRSSRWAVTIDADTSEDLDSQLEDQGIFVPDPDLPLAAFALPSISGSVPIARRRIRAALAFYRLYEYADDAAVITSELVTNAVQHVCEDGTETVRVALIYAQSLEAVTIVVTDSSPEHPVKLEPSGSSDGGRGLVIVDELAVRWGWIPEDGGKSVYAVLANEAGAVRGQRTIPDGQCVTAGANIRVLRQRRGWNQARLGEMMGWHSASTVCAAEGHRNGRQRGFTADEVTRLAAIFGVSAWQLTSRCANCDGRPPNGFGCLVCGVKSVPAADADIHPLNDDHAMSRRVFSTGRQEPDDRQDIRWCACGQAFPTFDDLGDHMSMSFPLPDDDIGDDGKPHYEIWPDAHGRFRAGMPDVVRAQKEGIL